MRSILFVNIGLDRLSMDRLSKRASWNSSFENFDGSRSGGPDTVSSAFNNFAAVTR